MYYYDLIVENKSRHTDELYTYGAEEKLAAGSVVSVRFGKGKTPKRGFVVRENPAPSFDLTRIKPILAVDEGLCLTEEMIDTCLWMRQRYGIRYMDGIQCFVPKGKPPKPGKEKRPYRNVKAENQEIRQLTGEQEQALRQILPPIRERRQESFLIHGVTGSGKTEVYMQAIAEVLAQGRSAIMLVPEIALTKQIIERFAGRFGMDNIAVLHSKLTQRERFDEWMRIRKGEARVVIGARIGVFAPTKELGLIIMDEEHESTYKSDQTPKYETVDIAYKRAMTHRCVLLLGSATPSVVSYRRAEEGIYRLIEMKERYNAVALPSVEMVDMKEELKSGNRTLFSQMLQQEIRDTLRDGSQVILFLNRRGYSTYVSCMDCGQPAKCPECGISLVYHKRSNALVCHYCGKKFPPPAVCPSCGSDRIRYFGMGTEQIEELTGSLFPEAVVQRLDLDTATSTRAVEKILTGVAKGETDILIGTQLVAKGLDFRNVGLVGVMSADVSLNIPDYRAAERTFQLVTQVAGRAGRGDARGRVIVQTSTPDNFALIAAASHDYDAFYRQEIAIRQFMGYPPETDLIVAEFTADTEEEARQSAEVCRGFLIREKLPGADTIFQPRESTSFKGKDSVRWHILIKAPRGTRNKYIHYLRYFADDLLVQGSGCNLTIDVNPYSSL